ncbi:MAG: GNAT family N-acetyltransferase [Alphaproteobacteria bacterium]|nr:GNAT family N-acetyltransferase [Alphaproteobacteria bacterium]
MTSFSIRPATESESQQIKRLVEKSGRWTDYWDSGLLLALFDADTDLTGWARHWPTPQGRHGIMSVTIDERYRGKKLGLVLISNLVASLPEVDRWHLDCAPNLAFYYARLGFRAVPRTECPEMFAPNDPVDQLCMACSQVDFRPFALYRAP